MSTPEPMSPPPQPPVVVDRGRQLVERRPSAAVGLTRTTRAAAWAGWHAFELTGIAVPAVLAVWVSPWFALASAGVATWWVVHEVRQRREGGAR